MKALITGGAGFLGSHLAEALLARGDTVHILDNLSTGSIDNIEHLKAAPRFHYAIDSVNFKPVDVSSALETLEAPYLPLIIQEAAGLPLDPTFAEQKKILKRCQGRFFLCSDGAEARRFNRLLIGAGLIKGL